MRTNSECNPPEIDQKNRSQNNKHNSHHPNQLPSQRIDAMNVCWKKVSRRATIPPNDIYNRILKLFFEIAIKNKNECQSIDVFTATIECSNQKT